MSNLLSDCLDNYYKRSFDYYWSISVLFWNIKFIICLLSCIISSLKIYQRMICIYVTLYIYIFCSISVFYVSVVNVLLGLSFPLIYWRLIIRLSYRLRFHNGSRTCLILVFLYIFITYLKCRFYIIPEAFLNLSKKISPFRY